MRKIPESILSDAYVEALEVDADVVLSRVRSRELRLEDAQWRHGVVLRGSAEDGSLSVDREATAELRQQIRVAGAPHGGA